jgi:tetratricopeptide (TPR) repeat protein
VTPADRAALLDEGGKLQLAGRYDDALALADAALKRDPECGEAWLVRGDALANSGRHEQALEAYARSAESEATAPDASLRIGKMRRVLGDRDGALTAFDMAEALSADPAPAAYERGILRLERGEFADGWKDYEARWRSSRFAGSWGFVPRAMVPHLKLAPTRESLTGKRVLLMGEQGPGDQIMFASMLPDLAATASRVLCVCEPRLLRLLRMSFPDVEFAAPQGLSVSDDDFDAMVAMGSLGSAFRRAPEDFPGALYLTPSDTARAVWGQRLGERTARLRIGVSWRGGVAQTGRHMRSTALADLAPLASDDVELVSLQYGDVDDEIAAAGLPVRAFPHADTDDFDDLAGLIANLDAVVSVQNTTVHLAGALGKTCLALLPKVSEWRYTRQGEAMPWYGSVRLLRQGEAGGWAGVIGRAAEALDGL